MNKDKHQESAAAEALHNLKAGDGKDSEDQTSVNNQRARRGTTASQTAAALAAAAASAKHKTLKTQNSTPFPDNATATPGDDPPIPVVDMAEVVNEQPASNNTASTAEKSSGSEAAASATIDTADLDSIPPPQQQVFYIDSTGKEQGPYDIDTMMEWLKLNFFRESTMIKMSAHGADFVPLNSVPVFAEPLAKLREQQRTFIETGSVPPFTAGCGSSSIGNASPFQGTSQFQGHDYPKPSAYLHNFGASSPQGGASSKKRSASPTPGKTSSKRIKGTPAKNPVQLKDAVVRANFESFTERFEVCQKMTTYDNPKKVKNNPGFLPVAVTMDQVVEKPDEHDMSDMWRELPLWTVFLPRGQSAKDYGERLEAFGKALQNLSAHNKKKCREFNAKVVHDSSEYYIAHYGAKRRKKGGKHNGDSES
jgi:hypothetical protein